MKEWKIPRKYSRYTVRGKNGKQSNEIQRMGFPWNRIRLIQAGGFLQGESEIGLNLDTQLVSMKSAKCGTCLARGDLSILKGFPGSRELIHFRNFTSETTTEFSVAARWILYRKISIISTEKDQCMHIIFLGIKLYKYEKV